MGKQKKATLHDASGKKILHPAEAERKKFKQRARENRAKNRKKNYETKMLQKAPELIEAEINDFQEMEKKGKLTKWKKDKMTREIAFYGRLKNQVEQNNSKRMEDQAGDQFFVDFEELKIHRKASIYYDPVKNPYGAPPSGQVLMYRHPDGSVKREPPELPSGVSSTQLTQGLVPGHGDMVLPHQRPMQEEEDDGESEESEDDDDEEDDEPMLPSELPDGTPLPASSSSPPPPEPPEPPGLPPLPPGPPPLTSLPPMPPGPPPGCGGGVGRGPPMMPKLPCFGGGAPQSQADFAKQMMNIGFMPVPPPVVPEVMGVSGPVPKRPVQSGRFRVSTASRSSSSTAQKGGHLCGRSTEASSSAKGAGNAPERKTTTATTKEGSRPSKSGSRHPFHAHNSANEETLTGGRRSAASIQRVLKPGESEEAVAQRGAESGRKDGH